MTREEQLRRFGTALTAARKRARISQEELGELLHVGRGMVSQWETGKSGIQRDRCEQLERVLSVPAGTFGWMFGYTAPPSVDDLRSARAAILADENLTDEGRAIVLGAYDAAADWGRGGD